MKKISFILLAGLALAACDKDAVSPVDNSATLDEAADLAFGTSFIANAGNFFIPDVLRHLPDALKLSAAQEASIKALLDGFRPATQADREALADIAKRARAAATAGASSDAVRAILAGGMPLPPRLAAAGRP